MINLLHYPSVQDLTCFTIGYDILPPHLNMNGLSGFVSCPIALKSWVKLRSPIGYILIFVIFCHLGTDNISGNDPVSQKFPGFTFWKSISSAKNLQSLRLLHICQLRARSLKILSRSDHICRSKEVKVPKIDRNLLKLAILKLFQPGITQGILKSTVKKATYQVSVC